MTLKWTKDTEHDNTKIAIGMKTNNYTGKLFEIVSCGGSILVKHWFLNIYHTQMPNENNQPFLHLVFWNFKSCKEFAEKLNAGEPVIITSLMLTPAYG